MFRLTGLGKTILGIALGAMLGVGFTLAPSANSQQTKPIAGLAGAKTFGEDAAAIIAFIQATVLPFFQQMLQSMIVDSLLGKGDTAITEQVAANTVGVQSALQQHAAVTVDALTQQSIDAEKRIAQRIFGNFSRMTVGGRTVTVGSNAPSACRRVTDAQNLVGAHSVLRQTQSRTLADLSSHNTGYGTEAGTVAKMRRDVEEHGFEVFDLGFLDKESLTPTQAQTTSRALAYALNPEPLPPAPPASVGGSSMAVREYEVKAEQLRRLSEVPQAVMARQLALRTGGEDAASANGKKSYLEIIRSWAQKGVEDSMGPTALQAKTEAGIQREMALTLSALLWVETERMQADHERNLMLAILTSGEVNERADRLRGDYTKVITAD